MRFSLWLLALVSGLLSLGALGFGCSDEPPHLTFMGPIGASPVPPRLGRPESDAGDAD
jgi:hypothetical protein